jgi:hypothetical protein
VGYAHQESAQKSEFLCVLRPSGDLKIISPQRQRERREFILLCFFHRSCLPSWFKGERFNLCVSVMKKEISARSSYSIRMGLLQAQRY